MNSRKGTLGSFRSTQSAFAPMLTQARGLTATISSLIWFMQSGMIAAAAHTACLKPLCVTGSNCPNRMDRTAISRPRSSMTCRVSSIPNSKVDRKNVNITGKMITNSIVDDPSCDR